MVQRRSTRQSWADHFREEFFALRWGLVVAIMLGALGALVDHKTRDRYTGTQAAADWEIQHREDARQDGLIAMIIHHLGLTADD